MRVTGEWPLSSGACWSTASSGGVAFFPIQLVLPVPLMIANAHAREIEALSIGLHAEPHGLARIRRKAGTAGGARKAEMAFMQRTRRERR